MNNLKFSVITVSFNHGEFIRQTIESVLHQRYPNFEHIIVDGGSTDDTTSILKCYPHLQWVSEPDRGQSHALNKGFRKASGDIIAWLNSDDWYPPGIFKDVALALEDYPVVMAACELTDRYGVRELMVPNIERNWYDLLKYWVYYSSPAQPSIFFRRSVLDEIAYAPGLYIDEDLDFCMDYDLWLRMAKRYPLSRRVNRVWSYYRMYETNKTGQKTDGAYREMERVFRRYSRELCRAERSHCFLLPINNAESPELEKTLESISKQTLLDQEVLVLDYCEDNRNAQALRRKVLLLGDKYRAVGLRYSRSEDASNVFEAIDHGMKAVRSPVVTVLESGDTISSQFNNDISKLFAQDNLALALPFSEKPDWRDLFLKIIDGKINFHVEGLFLTPFYLPRFTIRQAAWSDLGGFCGAKPLVAFRKLLLRLVYKGWAMNSHNTLQISNAGDMWRDDTPDLLDVFRLFTNATIIADLLKEHAEDPFSKVRAQHGFCLLFPEPINESARRVSQLAPQGWGDISPSMSVGQLETIAAQAPQFSPTWYCLAQQARQCGMQERSLQAQAEYERLKGIEATY